MIVNWPKIIFPLGMLAIAGMLSGCTQLPLGGPEYRDIHTGAATTLSNGRDPLLVYTSRHNVDFDYALVDLNPNVLSILDTVSPGSFYKTFGEQRGSAPVIRVGVGDVVQTAIFESSAGGLFVPGDAVGRSGNYVTLPAQTVSSSGTISIPYAGQIKAAGRSLHEIQRDIEGKLATRAIEPQVIVNITEQNSDSVTVIGDAGQNRIKLTGAGERILDVISKVGGGGGAGGGAATRMAAYELVVTLQRKNRLGSVPITTLVKNPKENIYVAAGDVLYVHREQKTFVAIGALASNGGGATVGAGDTTGLQGLFQFGQEHLSLNEAIAKAGGLTDGRANPSQVFLYRGERRETLERMGVDLHKFHPDQPFIPTVYRANFRDPSALFMAQQFEMRDKDIIYVANADSIQVAKALNYMNLWTSSAASAATNAVAMGDLLNGAHVFGSTGTAVVVTP